MLSQTKLSSGRTLVDRQPMYDTRPAAGGSLRAGMDRLVRTIERRIDQQVLSAQIRAYNISSVPTAKSGDSVP